MDEFEVLERWRAGRVPPAGEVWAGDDGAVVSTPQDRLVLVADAVVEAVHFDRRWSDSSDVGWRALASNISDVAAMGAVPRHALVTMVVGPGFDVDGCNAGLQTCAEAFGVAVVGGDLSVGATTVVSVALTGVLDDGVAPVLRSGAVAGDAVVVTGPLGLAAAELAQLVAGAVPADVVGGAMAHRRPTPRVAEGIVAAGAGATAMIDVSDGLLADLGHIAEASGLGFRLDGVPAVDVATTEQALTGGDDHELVICHPDPEALFTAFDAAGLSPPITIGAMTGEPVRTVSGRTVDPALGGGWRHRW